MHICGENTHDVIYFHDNNIAYYYNLQNGCGSPETYELMQYTGLKDKNEKEIYEGDIVNILDENTNEDESYVVKYSDIDGRYELEGEGYILHFGNIFSYQCEIIGNIYDNPELLESEE